MGNGSLFNRCSKIQMRRGAGHHFEFAVDRPAPLSGSIRQKVCAGGRKLFVLLPDGRLWAAGQYETKELDRYVEVGEAGRPFHWEKVRWPIPVDGMFLGTSNWLDLASTAKLGLDLMRLQQVAKREVLFQQSGGVVQTDKPRTHLNSLPYS
jgi:hypothetical protein